MPQGLNTKPSTIKLNPKWLLVSLLMYSGYWIINAIGLNIIPVKAIFPSLNWAWGEKLTIVIYWLLALAGLLVLTPNFKASDAGFTLKHNPGSIKAALVAIGILLIFRFYLSFLLGGDDGSVNPEELLFLATMNGLEKEPLFRGILLYTASLAIIAKSYSFMNAKISIAGILLVVLFALPHGFTFSSGDWSIYPTGLIITAIHGFVYLWMRERTGSLILPILAHNGVSLFGQFL
jgi:membrane protease YdiL (CAAX protease family)